MPDDDSPVLFAYDGSDQAKAAIAQAGRHLRSGRPAVVVTVWEPIEAIPFYGAPVITMSEKVEQDAADRAGEVAEEGARLAREAGFEATSAVERGFPVWERIVAAAEAQGAGLIVLGSHGRSGAKLLVLGSVATSVAHHTKLPVFIGRPE